MTADLKNRNLHCVCSEWEHSLKHLNGLLFIRESSTEISLFQPRPSGEAKSTLTGGTKENWMDWIGKHEVVVWWYLTAAGCLSFRKYFFNISLIPNKKLKSWIHPSLGVMIVITLLTSCKLHNLHFPVNRSQYHWSVNTLKNHSQLSFESFLQLHLFNSSGTNYYFNLSLADFINNQVWFSYTSSPFVPLPAEQLHWTSGWRAPCL